MNDKKLPAWRLAAFGAPALPLAAMSIPLVVYLPPYAPNLNLIERLWWFFKKKALWNTHYRTLADFRAAIRAFFDNLSQWTAELASLLTNRFHLIGHKTPQISAT